MKVTDATIVDVMQDHYHNTAGIDITSDFFVDKFFRVRMLLNTLNGEGFSDLEVLKVAAKAFEQQVIQNS